MVLSFYSLGGDTVTKLLIACVAENTEEFHFRTITLFKTIQKFGGNLAKAKLAAIFIDDVEELVAEQLKSMGVIVDVTKPYGENFQRNCNKIRMLEIDEDYDVLVALDCDIAVTRDFSSEISTDEIRVCDSLIDPLTLSEWEYVYDYFNLPIPENERKIHANSSVLFIPKKYVKPLRDIWLHYCDLVGKAFYSNDQWTKLGEHIWFTEPFALSLAYVDKGIERDLLPAEFHIHINGSHQSWANKLHPYFLHYHHNITEDWKLKTTGMEIPDQYVKMVNNLLEE